MKKVLIFGASSSLGEHIIKLLLDKNCEIFATTHSTKLSNKDNVHLKSFSLDFKNTDSVNQFCTVNLPKIQGIDSVIFLNGLLLGNSLSEYTENLMHDVMNVNFIYPAYLLKYIIPRLNPNSNIIYTSSISGFKGSFDPIYSASKSAMLGFIKSMATSLPPGIRINAIAPGLIQDSNMYSAMDKKLQSLHTKNTPTQKLTSLKDIAEIYVNLCEPHWSNLHGQVIHINGGSF
jgi:3-oxoacyl-[acyl-carrier protein] reductase